jgi:hypothetical protein
MQLRYAIKYLSNMDSAVAFHRDALYADREACGTASTMPPAEMHGQRIARFVDPGRAETSVSG